MLRAIRSAHGLPAIASLLLELLLIVLDLTAWQYEHSYYVFSALVQELALLPLNLVAPILA